MRKYRKIITVTVLWFVPSFKVMLLFFSKMIWALYQDNSNKAHYHLGPDVI